MPHQRGLLDLGADHDSGRVAQEQQRDVEGVAQLHEARGLVGAGAVDRTRQMHGIVRDEADRPPFDTDQRGDHAEAEMAAQFQHRAGIGECLDDGAHVVNAQAILGNDGAQQALIGAYPVANFSLEIR